jgi:hypothetical protein
MLINREFVSKNFSCRQKNYDKFFTYDEFIEQVNFWKAILLEKHKAKAGQTIGLGWSLVDINYFAAAVSAAEIGMILVVLDNVAHNPAKLNIFYPLDLFIKESSLSFDGLDDLLANCKIVEDSRIVYDYVIQHPEKFQQYTATMCSPQDVVMYCTSSGTTGTPKKIQHSHKFMSELAKRNAKIFKFDGNVCHTCSLHHGSSLATYWLPALTSDQCKSHHIFPVKTRQDIIDLAYYCQDYEINHLQLPLWKHINEFLEQSRSQQIRFNDLTIYTLSYIEPAWQNILRELGNVKIISLFGCNEASGPIMSTKLDAGTIDFDPKKFYLCDDFYQVTLDDDSLRVALPVYQNLQVTMQDKFTITESAYTHHGRNDIFRVNDIEIDVAWFLSLPQSLGINGTLVFDTVRQKIYYANWDNENLENNVARINCELTERCSLTIDRFANLEQDQFIYGIKIDHDMIRQRFQRF